MADTKTPTNLNPLPLGEPVAANQPLTPATPPATSTAPEPTVDADPVEQWIQDNPTFTETPATPQATEMPASAPTGEIKPVAADAAKPTDATTSATEPNAATPAQPQATDANAAQPTTTSQPAKPTLASDEKIGLAEGVEWTRQQIVDGLKERAALQPIAKEGENYKKLFGMSFEDAEKNWAPILQRLATEPNTLMFLDAYLGNAERAAYLEQCAQYFDQQMGSAPAAPASAVVPTQPAATQPQAAADPTLARELAELKAWKAQQEQQASADRVNREMAQATEKYPFLATDAALRDDLLLTARALWAQDQTKGLLDALALKAPMYDALAIARAQTSPTPAPAVETPAPQPVLLGTSGASPNGARPSTNGRPKQFGSTDDAVDDWYSNPPPEFRG